MANIIEEMASKTMAATKEVKARLKGMHGIFAQLMKEHGEVAALLKRVEMTSDPEVRGELFPQIRENLLAHEEGELAELYPVLRQHSETRAMAIEHDTEAAQLRDVIQALHTMAYDAPSWGETFKQLVSLVQHHVDEEESQYFPKANDVLGKERSEQLEATYLRMKSQVKERLAANAAI
jgi:hemerythrin-like domain-containing protein